MFNFLHQLVAKSFSLVFGVAQVAYSGLIRGFCWKQLLETAAGNRVDEGSETEPYGNHELKEAKNLHRAAKFGDDSLWLFPTRNPFRITSRYLIHV